MYRFSLGSSLLKSPPGFRALVLLVGGGDVEVLLVVPRQVLEVLLVVPRQVLEVLLVVPRQVLEVLLVVSGQVLDHQVGVCPLRWPREVPSSQGVKAT